MSRSAFSGRVATCKAACAVAPEEIPARTPSSRANRRDVQIVLSVTVPTDEAEGIYYFGTALSTSDAGRTIATHLSASLGLTAIPRAMPILKETRAPAVVVAVTNPDPHLAVEIARAVIDLYASGPADT